MFIYLFPTHFLAVTRPEIVFLDPPKSFNTEIQSPPSIYNDTVFLSCTNIIFMPCQINKMAIVKVPPGFGV